MPYATGAALHHDRPLAQLAIAAFSTQDENFIGDRLFPAVQGLGKQSDRYFKFDPDAWLRAEETIRAPRTKAREVNWTVSSDSYFADNHALSTSIPLEDLANADQALMLRENAAKLVTGLLRLGQEIRIANIVTSGTQCGSYVVLSGVGSSAYAQWTNVQSADILGQVNTAHAFVRGRTGMVPNTAVMDWDSFQLARRNERLLNMFRYTSGGELSEDQVKTVLKVSTLLIGKGVKNTAKEGQALTLSNIWSDGCWLGYVNPNPTGMQTATFGLRFPWRNPIYPDNFAVLRNTYAGAGEEKVEVVEVGHFQDEKVVGKDLGYLISDTVI